MNQSVFNALFVNKLKILIGLLWSVVAFQINAQDIDLRWSDKIIYDNKLDGFFGEYVGSNPSFVYAKFHKGVPRPKKQNEKIKLLALDKNTMKKAGEAGLIGYSFENKDLQYYNTYVVNNTIYIIWTRRVNKTIEVHAQVFNEKLSPLVKTKKIYEIGYGPSGYDNLLILTNPALNDRILVGREFEASKGNENLKLEFRLLDPELNTITTKQITLPVIIGRRKGLFGSSGSFTNLACTYNLGADGRLYVQHMVRLSEEERRSLKRRESSVYPHLMQVNMENGDLQEYALKFPCKNTFQFSALIQNNAIRLYGFFSDLDKDASGKNTHGIFFVTLDNGNFNHNNLKFSYFTKDFLDVLYEADKENRRQRGGLFNSAKGQNAESLDDNYIIEKVVEDGRDIVLFCTIMHNWQTTVCTPNPGGAGVNCTTNYYCTKSNVTTFRLDATGEISWARNIDRQITYNRWNVYDLNVIMDDHNFYIVYGSGYQINAPKKNFRTGKSRRQLTDRFEYAVLNKTDGSFKKKEYQVNKLNVKRRDARFVRPDDIQVFDNKMYVSCENLRLKPGAAVACLVCFPVYYFLAFNTGVSTGEGYLGVITTAN